MGFETDIFSLYLTLFYIWSIPMGFETSFEFSIFEQLRTFEVSLWDLKLESAESLTSTSKIWSIPMGFETP